MNSKARPRNIKAEKVMGISLKASLLKSLINKKATIPKPIRTAKKTRVPLILDNGLSLSGIVIKIKNPKDK
jgi:hypothetical protein